MESAETKLLARYVLLLLKNKSIHLMLFDKLTPPAHIRFLFSVYLRGLLIFTFLRILLLAMNISELSWKDYGFLPGSFFYGFRFDTCISCYLLTLPFVFSSLGGIFIPLRKLFFFLSFYLTIALYCVAFFICCVDIPYFNHFSSRITTASLLWADSPVFMARMILGTFSYWIYLLVFFGLCIFFVTYLNKIKANVPNGFLLNEKMFSSKSLICFILLAPVVFLGIRGRVAKKSPLVLGTAYFCDNNFLNQLGLNPVFSFMTSVLEDQRPENKRLNLMDDATAVLNVKKYLNSGIGFTSPVARKVTGSGEPHAMNVVLVIMEGMCRYAMGESNAPNSQTPVLDSLKTKSLWFENIYTQGIHTFNGIYSSLYSYPSLLKRHPLRNIPSKKFYAMPLVFKDKGYKTVFFITHDGQFDNAQGFLTANGFDRVYAEQDYPSEKVLSTLGVPDDYLFEYSIPKMNELDAQNEKFFCGFMTGSNHYPLIFPDWVKKHFSSTEEPIRIIQYSDWAVGQFIKKASAQSWYKKTIFVFVADHGTNRGGVYEMPLSFHHSPLIIFAPGLNLEPKSYDCFGGQMDIFPTLMGLMHLPYVNNTMGIDLLNEKRPFTYFTADDKIGCINKEYYFIHCNNGKEYLYRYANKDMTNYVGISKAQADSMRTYAFSMLQTTQWVMENGKFAEK
jgi:phosphoglycerol transferase MdoB-like AlkP superfamily enzyme